MGRYQQTGQPPAALLLPDHIAEGPLNTVMVQINIRLPCVLDFVFVSGLDGSTPDRRQPWIEHREGPDTEAEEEAARLARLSGPMLTQLLRSRSQAFEQRFQDRFGGPDGEAEPPSSLFPSLAREKYLLFPILPQPPTRWAVQLAPR